MGGNVKKYTFGQSKYGYIFDCPLISLRKTKKCEVNRRVRLSPTASRYLPRSDSPRKRSISPKERGVHR